MALLTMKEAARRLNMPPESLRKGRRGTDRIPRLKMGGRVQLDDCDIEQFIERLRQAAIARINQIERVRKHTMRLTRQG